MLTVRPALPGPEEIRFYVSKITSSRTFVRSERLCRFLQFVVARTLEGRGEELKEYLLGVEVFDKGVDFDPRMDSAVRVDARRVRAKLAEYYAAEGASDEVRVTLPKGSYIPSFGWALHEAKESAPPPVADKPARPWVMWVAVALGVAGAAFGGWRVWERIRQAPATVGGVRSVAVLPFSNMTGRPDNESLCDGLAEEMIGRLSRLPGLRVVSRSSAFVYKGRQVGARQVARELQVDSILEGSVREGNEALRITVQLVRAGDGSQLWSETFNLMKGDELGVQAHLGRRVEARLAEMLPAGAGYKPEVSEEDQRLDALVIQAGYLVQRHAEEGLTRAIEYAGRSVAARPSYAPAYAVLADAWLAMADHRDDAARADAVDQARRNARKAIELNPGAAGPLTTLGSIAMDYEWNWTEAESLFRRATELNASLGLAHARYARLLSLQGRHAEAVQRARHAEMLTPLSVTAMASVGQAQFYARKYEDAIVELSKAIEIDPGYDNGRLTLAKCYGFLGRYDDAWRVEEHLSPAADKGAEAAALRAFLYGRQGKIAEAKREISAARKASSISRVTALAAMGEREEAMRVIEEAVREREQNVVYLKVSPGVDPLRGDARIERLCGRIGLTGCAAIAPR
jgi:TolB-like protein/Tfp pilus assembly protein PilF